MSPLLAVVFSALLPLRLAADAPAPRQWTLPNGLRVVFQNNPPTATVVMCAFVRVTALHEVRVGPGVRQLTNMMLARADCCEQLVRNTAARVDAALAPDYAEVIVSASAESLDECAQILRSVLYSPKLTGGALEQQRALVLRRFAARGELPAEYAFDLAHARLYPDLGAEAYMLGDPVAVSELTLEQVRRFHAAHYLPNATVVSISGGVSYERTRALINDRFGGLLPGGMPQQAPMTDPSGGERIAVRWPGPTAAICVAARAVSLDSTDYLAAATAMVLLSSGSGSRLHRALRGERGLAYTIAGDITPSAVAPVATVLVTAAQERGTEVERLVAAEIDRLVTEPADVAELRRAKQYLIGQHALRHQRNSDIAHYLGAFELLGGVPGYRLDGLLASRLAAVGAEDVRAVAAHIFHERLVAVLAEADARP